MAIATFRRLGGDALPRDGRSSDETLGGSVSSYLASFGSVNPVIDFQILQSLKYFWLFNPDVSQYVANIRNLGNPGHQLSVDARTDAAAEAAVNRLNETASRIYTHGTGVDGLMNQYLDSVAWSGAVSSEDVVNLAGGRVERVVMVPVEQIRFVYNKELDIYEPHQRAIGGQRAAASRLGLIKLNTETYKYVALSTVENSPYAKPPATAAVEAILTGQEPIMQNLRFMAQKVGLLGFIDYSATKPIKRAGETDTEYSSRCTQYVADLASALDGNLNKGMLVHTSDQKVTHEPVTTGAAGVYDLNRISEEQVFSGLGAMPGFHGRTDSTTETFADVVYYLLTSQVANMQRVVKRRQEATYRLDLRLGGIEVDGVTLTFDKAHSRNAKAEAETDEIRFRDTLARIKNGAITPDEGAQELGYETWADEELLFSQTGVVPRATESQGELGRLRARKTLTLKFNKASQRYRRQPDVIYLASGDEDGEAADNVVGFPSIKKKALAKGASN